MQKKSNINVLKSNQERVMKKLRIALSIILTVICLIMFILSVIGFEFPKYVSLIMAIILCSLAVSILILVSKKEL
jgi:Kef-type K+ transport system membrane component KefB